MNNDFTHAYESEYVFDDVIEQTCKTGLVLGNKPEKAAGLPAKSWMHNISISICSVGVSCSVAIAATRVRIPADAF